VEPTEPYVGRLLSFFDSLFAPNTSAADGSSHDEDETQDERVRRILVVTHGGPIKTLVPALIADRGASMAPHVLESNKAKGSVDKQRATANCSITTVEVEIGRKARGSGDTRVVTVTGYGDVNHLRRGDRTGVEGGDADLQ
jgi:broad specificity phosphatase PhoE